MKVKFLALAVAATVFAATSANAAVPGSWTIGAAGGWEKHQQTTLKQTILRFIVAMLFKAALNTRKMALV